MGVDKGVYNLCRSVPLSYKSIANAFSVLTFPSFRLLPPFNRAIGILEDAMRKGHVPSIVGVEDGPTTVDLREIPPTIAEVMVLAVLAAFERRADKTGKCFVGPST